MPTPSEKTPNAECEARNEKPRSIFGNFAECENAFSERGSLISNNSESTATLRLTEPRSDESIPLQTQIDTAVARSFLHHFIAKLFEYPTAETWAWLVDSETIKAFSFAAAALNLTNAGANPASALRSSRFESFLDAHLAAFGHAARGPVPMNEIEYGDLKADPLFQPHRLADLAAFYRAFGLEVTSDASERQDHICLELEFMSVLAVKEAFALEHQLDNESLSICRAAQKNFLREHLGRWTPAFTRRVERTASELLLQAAARFAHEFIAAECARSGVKSGSEDLVLRSVDEEAEQLCASCGIHELPPGALTST